ncbi:MAG: hypothetical protein PHU95_02300 [Candidatus Thermoplasmatota archaeon]|nr:hypothetical protein [Candidatus Thermoplasmatota archaeon]MDD5778263.1 hypothetical protein [Candidatus Thermoplasmatota archaeon]
MGKRVPVDRPKPDVFEVFIPEALAPVERLPFKTEEVRFPRQVSTVTYVYGGGDVVTVDGVALPRTGVWGRVNPEEGMFIPLDAVLIGVRRDDIWVPIEEAPRLSVVPWASGRWRASIPKAIRVKYRIVPGMPALIQYSQYVTSWEELRDIKEWKRTVKRPMLTVYHHNIPYDADWIDDGWLFSLPPAVARMEGLHTAFSLGIVPDALLHYDEGIGAMTCDFDIASGWDDKRVAQYQNSCHRNMAVRNYSLPGGEEDYPFLLEVRATLLTTPSKMFYQDGDHHMDLLRALDITVYNTLRYFFMQMSDGGEPYNPMIAGAFEASTEMSISSFPLEHEGGVYRDDEGRPVETMGEEENVRVSYGEAAEFPFGRVDKYIRIVNKHSHARRGHKPYVYLNDAIEKKCRRMGAIVDKKGFLWRTRGGD